MADDDEETGESWCGDCRLSWPIIERLVEESDEDIALLRVNVGERPAWKDPAHSLRHDPAFMVSGVPSVMFWDHEAEAVGARVGGELEEAETGEEVEAIMRDFLGL